MLSLLRARLLPVLLVGTLSSLASAAPAGPTRVVIIGPDESLGAEVRDDVHRRLEVALSDSARRGVFVAAKPSVATASCPRTVTQACLLKAAKGDAVLRVRTQRTGNELTIWISLLEGVGRMTAPVSFKLGAGFESSAPVQAALERLEAIARPPPSADALLGAPSATTIAAATYEVSGTEDAAIARTDWPAIGGWGAVGGLALLVGGVVVGVLGRNLNDDLTARHMSNSLIPADRANYDRLGTYNVLANTLFVSGGLVTATGLYLWGSADSGARVGVSRTF